MHIRITWLCVCKDLPLTIPIHVFFISNRFISNQYSALKNTNQLQQLDFFSFMEPCAMVGVLGPRLSEHVIKWKLYQYKKGARGIKIIKTEQTYLIDYPNHIHSRDMVLKIKQLLSNFQYSGLSKVKQLSVLGPDLSCL